MKIPIRRLLSVRSVVWASVVLLAFAGGVVSFLVIEPIACGMGEFPPCSCATGVFSGMAATTLLLAAALAIGLRSTSHVGSRTIIACSVLGALNCGATWMFLGFAELLRCGPGFSGPLDVLAGATVAGLCMGPFVGAPLGLVYGLVLARPMTALGRLRERETVAAHWEALRIVGFTALGPAVVSVVVAVERPYTPVPLGLPLAVALSAFALALIGTLQRWRLALVVRNPERHGYLRLPLAELPAPVDTIPPLHGGVSPDARFVLVSRRPQAGPGAYRSTAPLRPLALVD